VIIALVVVAIAVMIVYSTVHGPRYRVEVCMAYQGRSACKKVAAKSEQAALRSGMENACADIASGVTDSMNCTQAQPQRVRWLERPVP
jgi:hypothetical protein